MKKILIASILAAMATGAMAEGRGNNYKSAPQNLASVKDVSSDSQAIGYIDNSVYSVPEVQTINTHQSGTSTVKTVATVYAPALTSSNDTCMGSTSFGATGIGFGVSIGSSWTDANCVMLKNAREMFNMGMPDVAFARLCMDPLNREAIELTGKVCPQTTRDAKAAAAQNTAAAQ